MGFNGDLMTPVIDIAYVRYQAPDLQKMEGFLHDFGLRTAARTAQALYMRAASGVHHCHITELGDVSRPIGFGFMVASEADLHALAPRVGSVVEDNPEPGGGRRVRFIDPAGFVVDVIHGQARTEPLHTRAPLSFNSASRRERLGATVRLKSQPSSVMRLGHVAVLVPDFAASRAFYEEHLGLSPSDTYYDGDESNQIAAFMHCSRGDEWTDHHTLALIQAKDGKARFDHGAFEVVDFDDVVQGGEFLKVRGHHRSWGIGRHNQGSQIFDYWRDPFGNKIEHWTDGDLVNQHSSVGNSQISESELAQWAPPLNPEFFS